MGRTFCLVAGIISLVVDCFRPDDLVWVMFQMLIFTSFFIYLIIPYSSIDYVDDLSDTYCSRSLYLGCLLVSIFFLISIILPIILVKVTVIALLVYAAATGKLPDVDADSDVEGQQQQQQPKEEKLVTIIRPSRPAP